MGFIRLICWTCFHNATTWLCYFINTVLYHCSYWQGQCWFSLYIPVTWSNKTCRINFVLLLSKPQANCYWSNSVQQLFWSFSFQPTVIGQIAFNQLLLLWSYSVQSTVAGHIAFNLLLLVWLYSVQSCAFVHQTSQLGFANQDFFLKPGFGLKTANPGSGLGFN